LGFLLGKVIRFNSFYATQQTFLTRDYKHLVITGEKGNRGRRIQQLGLNSIASDIILNKLIDKDMRSNNVDFAYGIMLDDDEY